MAKFRWSETFISIEGEGPHTGVPTVYVRFTGCNFECLGFNNPEMKPMTNEVLGFDPKDIKSLNDIPEINTGCDSIYAWDKRFKHIWHHGDENKLAEEIVSHLPDGKWQHPKTGQDYFLSLTGGEPTLRWKAIPSLLNHPLMDDLNVVLIETNCSVPIKDDFILALHKWMHSKPNRKVIWSNSPKLAVSGEPHDRAIRPDVAMQQTKLPGSEQYFKFVCDATVRDFEEVERAMSEYEEAYRKAGLQNEFDVHIMPVACTESQQQPIAGKVADMCIEKGYTYCHRVHNTIYANAIGK